VQPQWLALTISVFQNFAGELAVMTEVGQLRVTTARFLKAVQIPPRRLERMLLSPLLLDTAIAIDRRFHAQGDAASCRCHVLRLAQLDSLMHLNGDGFRTSFAQWIDEFVKAYRRNHNSCGACTAARLIRESPKQRWTVGGIARELGMAERRLRRQFRREFGIGVRDYLHLVRLTAAVSDLITCSMKIESIAHDVGYHSKKDLYRAFHKWLRVQPAELRRASALDQARVREKLLRRQYVRCSQGT
jgi:AraC-like DNA-binding protein